MRWYVLQAWTGREEKLVKLVREILPRHLYGECFVIYHERMWRRQQQDLIQVERLFPGYVFITSEKPEELFLWLRQVPDMSKLMRDGDFYFLSLDPGEAAFLRRTMDADHIIRLSYVLTDGEDQIIRVSGPLAACRAQVERYQFRKRYAVVRLRLLGEEKNVRLGIFLKEDMGRKRVYGGGGTPAAGDPGTELWRTEAR